VRWEEALAAAESPGVRCALAAHQLSYRYLHEGPVRLAEREGVLRRTVASMPHGTELPVQLRRDLLAWQKAIAMAHRRLPWDLPRAWSDTPLAPPGPGNGEVQEGRDCRG
jgi:hypothetical protein